MGRFDHHPPHVRRKIALMSTVGIGVILLGLMVILYTKPKYRSGEDTAMSKLHSFYTTITDSAQSYFDTK